MSRQGQTARPLDPPLPAAAPEEAAPKSSGALARGLRVLTALNDLETATVAGLVHETGLPKPTVIRLLQTLEGEGFAAHDRETGTYRATDKVARLSRAFVGRDRARALVQSVLDRLGDELKWPCEYLVPDDGSMVVRLNNRERAPIKLRLFERRRFPMLGSAAGIAHLAAQCEARLNDILTGLQPDARARDWLALARRDGFAVRELVELGPNMCVVAVAVPGERGALSLVYFNDVVDHATLREVLVPRVREAAHEVAAAELGQSAK